MGYNIRHKILSSVLWAILGVVLLLVGVSVLVYTPWFQGYLKNAFVRKVNASNESVTLSLDQFHIHFPLNVEINGLSVVDNATDTIIAAKSFSAHVRLLPLLKGEVKVNDASLTHGRYQIGSLDSTLCIVIDANLLTLTNSKVDLPTSVIDLDNVYIDGGIVDLTLKEDTVAPSDHSVVKWEIKARNVQMSDFTYRMTMMPIIDSLGTHFDNALVQDVAVRLQQQEVSAKRFLGNNLDATYIIPSPDTPQAQPNAPASDDTNLWTVTVDSIIFHNSKAVYATRGVTPSQGLDFSYIAADSLDIGVSSFYNRATVTRIPITMFSATERCGITLSATGLLSVDSEKVTLDGFDVTTPSSALQFNAIIGIGDILKTPSLPLAVTGEGSVSVSDLLLAFPELKPFFVGIPQTDRLAIVADFSGSLSNMTVNNLSLFLANRVNAVFKGQMGNLTDYAKLYGNMSIKGEIANGDFLKDGFLDQASADEIMIPPLRLDGNVKMANGTIDGNVVATAHTGQLALDAKWNSHSEGYDANLTLKDFPMDAFMPLLGVNSVTGNIIVNGQGYDPFITTTSLHTIAEIQQVEYHDHIYSDISATAMVDDGNAEIWIKSANDDACFNMTANGNLSGDAYKWSMDGDISNIDLMALNLSTTKSDGSLSFKGKGIYEPASHNISANITVDDVTWNMPEWSIDLSDINATLLATESATNISLHNQDLSASLTVGCSLDSTMTKFSSAADTLRQQFSRRVFDISELHDVLPQFDLNLNAGTQNAISQYLGKNGMSFKNLELNVGNDSTVSIDGSLYGFKTASTRFDSIAVKAYQRDDQLMYKLTVDNKPGTFDSFAHVNLNGGISDNRASAFFEQRDITGDTEFNLGLIASLDSSVVKLNFVPFSPVIDYKEWTLNHDNVVTYDLLTHQVDANLKMQNDESSSIQLYTEQSTSGTVNDKELVLKIADLNLSNWLSVNPFAPPIKGSISTDLRFQWDQTMLNGKGSISLDDLYYGKERVGSFVTDMDIHTQTDGFVVAKASLMVDSLKAITLTGVLNDTTAATPLNLELAMTRFPLKTANPFLPKDVAKLSGTLNGKMDVTGELSKPILNGYINFDSTAVNVVMTGTPLTIPDTHIPVTDNLVTFHDFMIKGANDNPLSINGTVDVSNMALPKIQLNMKARNMQVIGSNKSKNVDVYGKGFIDFDATVNGNTSFLDIDASIDLLAGSNITYRMLEEASELKSRKTDDMVRFVQFSDTTHTEDTDTVAARELMMAINALMKISEGATINVELSADGKNKVQLQGDGSFNYTMSPILTDSRLTGRYTINKGYVRYTPPLMSEKLFNFKENSYVSFNGDMLNPTLSLYADDKIKTNVTQEGANSHLVNFDVSISVTNTLNDMNVVFDLATNDDITVANELSSMSAEQRANQAMNLLLYNVYTGTNTKGDANLSENVLFSFLESQVNTWAANNIKFIDISFGIDQYNRTIDGNTSTTMSYSYQVSKSLFNDRIKIAIGGSYSTDTEDEDIAQNLLNDISFEYLLNRSGTMSIKLFRHTGYESILEGEITKTGVGFVYKRKIRSLADIFRFGKKLPNFNDAEPSTQPSQPSPEPTEATDEQVL